MMLQMLVGQSLLSGEMISIKLGDILLDRVSSVDKDPLNYYLAGLLYKIRVIFE